MPERKTGAAPLRVAYETTLLEMNRTGGGRATRELGRALAELDGVQVVAVRQPPARASWRRGRIVRGLGRELRWLPFSLPRAATRVEAAVLHLPAPLSVPVTRVPLVLTIHDTFPWERPDWSSRTLALQQRVRVQPALGRLHCVIVPSAFTAGRVIERLGVDPTAVRVVPHGISAAFTADGPGASPAGRGERPYVLGQWSTVPRKNSLALLDCFERLADAGAPHDLVLFGDDGPADQAALARLARSRWRSRIRRTGWVSDERLAELYRGADVFVFPTLGEGFGFPVLEAMACGTPVASTTAGSVPEVAGGAAALAEPGCTEGLLSATRTLLESPEARTRAREAGLRQASRFAWRRTAELTLDAYRLAVERAA